MARFRRPRQRAPKIRSVSALEDAEARIGRRLGRYALDGVLWTLRENQQELLPFVHAGLAALAVRFCGRAGPHTVPVPWTEIEHVADAVARYLLCDPIVLDDALREEFRRSSPAFLLLRLMGSQFPFHVNAFEAHARPLLLFEEIPRDLAGRPGIPPFDFDNAFRATTDGVGVVGFVRVGFAAWGLSGRRTGFTLSDIESARGQGLRLPPPGDVRRVLRRLAASPAEFRQTHARQRGPDRRFAMYELNPLLAHPLIRPWGNESFWSVRGGRMIAPLPDLVTARFSLGIYHQMLGAYGTRFSDYFGHVFAEYCGRALRAAVGGDRIVSEDEIRRTYPSSRGQVPDWVVRDGQTAVLLECKSTRFTRAALATGAVEAVDDSLKQVLKGLKQLHRFREACRAGAPGLEVLHGCTDFLPVLLTLEPLHGINSDFFREHLDEKLRADGISDLPWQIVAMEELELVERHVRGGVPLAEAMSRMPTEEVVADYEARSGFTTNESSFLFPKHHELMDMLGLARQNQGPARIREV